MSRHFRTPEAIKLFETESEKYFAMRKAKDPRIRHIHRVEANSTFAARDASGSYGTSRTIEGAIAKLAREVCYEGQGR